MVIHSRHHSQHAWDRYREQIRAGWQFPPTNAYGVIQRDHFRNSLGDPSLIHMATHDTRRTRTSTILDRIESGELLGGTEEERRVRLGELLKVYGLSIPQKAEA